MLKKFSVKGFKGFEREMVLDLSKTRDYSFNRDLIRNELVNKAIIYGKNGSGKSNLGFAIYDLTIHLTDKQKPDLKWYRGYLNLNSKNNYATFKFEFLFDGVTYKYEYAKIGWDELLYEKITSGNEVILDYNYSRRDNIINIEEAQNLRVELPDNKLSILKYIYRNTPSNNSVITKIINFAEKMLWFRCVNDGNGYIGLLSGGDSMDNIIIRNNKIHQFEEFLAKNELYYKLEARVFNNQNVLCAKFGNGEALFSSIISTGTWALWLYYCWSIYFEQVSFLFLDEFDAFYHYETSELILKAINDNPNIQAVVTTHNTYLMKNSTTRPDCCFILTHDNVTALSDCTNKEIREAHNLEKMYRNGAFTEE